MEVLLDVKILEIMLDPVLHTADVEDVRSVGGYYVGQVQPHAGHEAAEQDGSLFLG
jgi:hypothetical protein